MSGFKFTINIHKSRNVIEGSKFAFIASFEDGIDKWTGLLDVALATGHVTKPSNGWYVRPNIDDVKYREKNTHSAEFWMPILQKTDFPQAVSRKFKLSTNNLTQEEESNE